MPVLTGWVAHTVDVAIIGAGSAGVSAARHMMAQRPDLSLVVLEASDRIGGRALTIAGPAGAPIDLGCGWLHGARTNAWTHIAGQIGFAIDKATAPWNRERSRSYGLSSAESDEAADARRAYFERLEARDPNATDAPMSDLLQPGNRWNELIGATGTYINGVELSEASIQDFQAYEPGPSPDWRVREGYGTLVASFGSVAPVALAAAVTRVDHGARQVVRLTTERGDLACRAALVTVSTDILAAEAIRFDPPLPEKSAAAADLPLGLANKLFLDVADVEFEAETHLLGSPHRVETAAYHLRPYGAPLIEAYFGGQLARDIEAAGPQAALAFVQDELTGHFGEGIRAKVSGRAFSRWAGNSWARGSYSYATPGRRHSRPTLAAPVGERLFFAGEATSTHRYSTAHGAYETGIRAADEMMAVLR